MGLYEKAFWDSDSWYSKSGPYSPYIPDYLMRTSYTVDMEAAGELGRATSDVIRLDASVQSLTSTEPLARLLMRSEAMASSRIEGLTAQPVRILEAEALDELGVAHRLDSTEAMVLANISVMSEAVSSMGEGDDLTVERLCKLNGLLLEGSGTARRGGHLRDEQNWIGREGGTPVGAAYVPPAPHHVRPLMEDLVHFCNESPLPTLEKAAIAHAQFETIHPFVDGNGRTGRALIQMILRRDGMCHSVTPPVSLVLATYRRDYIAQLAAFRVADGSIEGMTRDASELASFFARAFGEACAEAANFERETQRIRKNWREKAKPRRNSAADRLLDILPANPVVSVKSAERLTGRSNEACRLALASLRDAGILTQNSRNKKSNIYVANEIITLFVSLERSLGTKGGNTAVERPSRPVPQRRQR